MRLIKTLATILLALPLLSLGRLPSLPPATIAPQIAGPIVVPSWHTPNPAELPAAIAPKLDQVDRAQLPQACTYETASARRGEVFYDDAGQGPYPYGVVSAWSCSSFDAMQADFAARWTAMQGDASQLHAYRSACRQADPAAACPWPRP